jgi:DNA modification methylase
MGSLTSIVYYNENKNGQLNLEEVSDQIICADCLEVMKAMPAESIHLAITSPPYNVGVDYDVHNDHLEYEKYLNWLKDVWKELIRVLVDGGRFALNIAPTGIKNFRPVHMDLVNQLRDLGLIFRTEILWYKQSMTARRTAWGSWRSPSNPHIIPSWEYVYIFSKGSWNLEGGVSKIDITADEFKTFSDGFWHIPAESQRRGHPAPFPEELIYRLIKYYSYQGNVVLDMFGGTGTVAVVAYKTKRRFIHIDISEQYCKLAAKRLNSTKLAEAQLRLLEKGGAV